METVVERKFKGLLIGFGALVFSFLETAFFGWNMWPASLAEFICDMIVLFVYFLGVYVVYSRPKGAN